MKSESIGWESWDMQSKWGRWNFLPIVLEKNKTWQNKQCLIVELKLIKEI